MKLRTVALALTLACGFTMTVEARQNSGSHFRKAKKSKVKAQKSKSRKVRHHA